MIERVDVSKDVSELIKLLCDGDLSLRSREVIEVLVKWLIPHIEEYAVKQYGDKGEDLLTQKDSQWCVEQIGKYCHRYGRSSRGPADDRLSLLKIIHYACVAYVKSGEGQADV